jgi:hypothetical protein
MLKKILFGSVIIITAVTLAGCGASNGSGTSGNETSQTADKDGKTEASGMEAVCKYFPKELIGEAIGRPIVRVEDSSIAEDYICIYYTDYSETYDHTPYGDHPGGPQIVVVLEEDESLTASKADLEKYGYTFSKDESYAVDNRLISSGKDVYRADLIVNENKFFRITSNHFAVNADEIIKIGKRFAERMKNGK